MSDPTENKPKINGVNSNQMERLTSFKPTRNLTLGGPKPNKKIFTPNLNVTRNKNKGPSNYTQVNRKDDKSKRGRRNDRGKSNRGGANIIKSTGLFSEGPGRVERHHTSYPSYGADKDSPSLQRPVLRVKNVKKIDKQLEEQQIRNAVSSGVEFHEVEDFKHTDIETPVKLPMDDTGSSFGNKPSIPRVRVKREFMVKEEVEDLEYPDSLESAQQVKVKKEVFTVKKEVLEDTDLVQLLNTDQPTHILVKLPETLPGRGGALEDVPRRRQDAPEPADDTPKPCYLRQMEEGRIGKLQIHRSGRVMLALGDTNLEVNLGTKPAFLQEMMSVGADEASRSASIVSLGRLLYKMVVVPDWETILDDMP